MATPGDAVFITNRRLQHDKDTYPWPVKRTRFPKIPSSPSAPAYDLENRPQQIRIVFSGMNGFVPTALVALSLDEAELLCDRLNARLGLDRDAWSALVGRSMAAAHNGARAH